MIQQEHSHDQGPVIEQWSDVIIPLRPVSRFIQQEDRLQNGIIFYLENHTPFIDNGNNLLSKRNNFDVSDNKFQSWTISVGSV